MGGFPTVQAVSRNGEGSVNLLCNAFTERQTTSPSKCVSMLVANVGQLVNGSWLMDEGTYDGINSDCL